MTPATPGMPAPASGYEQGIAAAREAVGLSAWKHEGDDAYSRGMDAGAIHQVKQCLAAIDALAAPPAPELPAEVAAAVRLVALLIDAQHGAEWLWQLLESAGLVTRPPVGMYEPTPLGRALLERAGRQP